MADISAEIAAFENAIYGEDVRSALVSLATKINNNVNQALQFVSEIENIEAKIEQNASFIIGYNSQSVKSHLNYNNNLITKIFDNGYPDSRTGRIISTTTYYYTDYINVTGGQTYRAFYNNSYAWYDSTYTYISGGSSSSNALTDGCVAPANAAYIRIGFVKSDFPDPNSCYFTTDDDFDIGRSNLLALSTNGLRFIDLGFIDANLALDKNPNYLTSDFIPVSKTMILI